MSRVPEQTKFDPEFYMDLFYTLENAALVIDTSFTIRDANQAAVDLLRFESRSDLIGTEVQSILVDSDVLVDVAEHIATDQRWEGEVKIRADDNRIFVGTGTAVPVDHPTEGQMIVGLFSDLTRRRQYTRSVKILNRVLRHNFRNDANVIVGELEHLRSVTDEEGHEAIDRIYDILEEFLRRADRARELETLIRDRENHELRSIELTDYLDRTIEEARRRHGHADIEGPSHTDPVPVVGDETAAKVFHELIENAVQHNDADQPAVSVSLSVSRAYAVVSVSDNGPGVDPSDADRLFGRQEIDQLQHGSGMGLFFVDQVMIVYGGEVWIEENGPRGTTIKLRFPRVQ
jgi:signal transduction histidine kinase